MASVAEPYNGLLRTSLASLAETEDDGADPAFRRENAIVALDRLRLLAAKYLASKEARDAPDGGSATAPILCDPIFRNLAASVADKLDECSARLGGGAKRVAQVLRVWIDERTPAHAIKLESTTRAFLLVLKKAR